MKYRSLKEEVKILELGLPPKEDDGFIGGNLDPKGVGKNNIVKCRTRKSSRSDFFECTRKLDFS